MAARSTGLLLAIALSLVAVPALGQSPSPISSTTPEPPAPLGTGIGRAAVVELLSTSDVAIVFPDVEDNVDSLSGAGVADVSVVLEGPVNDLHTIHISGGDGAAETLGLILGRFAPVDAPDFLLTVGPRMLAGEDIRLGTAVGPFWADVATDLEAGTTEATLTGRPSWAGRDAEDRIEAPALPTPAPKPKPLSLRDSAFVSNSLGEYGSVGVGWFRKIKRCAYTKPKRNHVYLAIGVGYAAGEGGLSYGMYDWVAYDKRGRQFEVAFAFDCYDEMLDSGRLGPGRRTDGIVIFEVPKKAQGLKVAYRPSIFSEDEVTWRLKRKPKK